MECGAKLGKLFFFKNTQGGVQPMPKDRGAEQGDVDGPFGMQFSIGNGSGARRHETLESTSFHVGTIWKCLVM